jgi:PKD repeat protein
VLPQALAVLVAAVWACAPEAPAGLEDDDTKARPQAVITSPSPGSSFLSGQLVAFVGQASDVEDGALIGSALAWSSSIDGDLGTGEQIERSDLTVGSHTIRLVATDSDAMTDTSTVAITIRAPDNIAPVALFSAVCSNLDCSFTDLSTDADGTIETWSWTFGDGSSSSSPNPQHTYAAGGTYLVTLVVTDDGEAVDQTGTQITVVGGNQGPVARFDFQCDDLTCSFTDSSTDADGSVEAWAWDFGDASTSSDQSPTHEYGAAGTYTVSLTVTDDDGATGSTIKQVSPAASNVAPTADFTYGCTGLTCGFADASTDPDGTITARDWNFGDGFVSGESNPQHTYVLSGTYPVRLVVTDDDGATGAGDEVGDGDGGEPVADGELHVQLHEPDVPVHGRLDGRGRDGAGVELDVRGRDVVDRAEPVEGVRGGGHVQRAARGDG